MYVRMYVCMYVLRSSLTCLKPLTILSSVSTVSFKVIFSNNNISEKKNKEEICCASEHHCKKKV